VAPNQEDRKYLAVSPIKNSNLPIGVENHYPILNSTNKKVMTP
jgi:hypothetical protein